jgi:hypothetical protein
MTELSSTNAAEAHGEPGQRGTALQEQPPSVALPGTRSSRSPDTLYIELTPPPARSE